jgi:hypothetical protein
MHTRLRDETENDREGHIEKDRDISRIVETRATLGEIFSKAASHRLTNFYHFIDNERSMAITVGVQSSRHVGFSARIRP